MKLSSLLPSCPDLLIQLEHEVLASLRLNAHESVVTASENKEIILTVQITRK